MGIQKELLVCLFFLKQGFKCRMQIFDWGSDESIINVWVRSPFDHNCAHQTLSWSIKGHITSCTEIQCCSIKYEYPQIPGGMNMSLVGKTLIHCRYFAFKRLHMCTFIRFRAQKFLYKPPKMYANYRFLVHVRLQIRAFYKTRASVIGLCRHKSFQLWKMNSPSPPALKVTSITPSFHHRN